MGTSSDYGGGSGGAWTPAKRASTSFTKNGGTDRAARALAGIILALGGAGAVASRSGAAAAGTQRIGLLAATAAADGMDAALERFGLQDLVGQPVTRVLEALIELIGGSGDDLESQAARSAACDVFEELAEEVDSYEELAALIADDWRMRQLLQRFAAGYLYRLLIPVIDERLGALDDPEVVRAREREIREVIDAVVEQRLSDIDPLAIEWGSDEARETITSWYREMLEHLEALDQ